jgi:hypothetical protein
MLELIRGTTAAALFSAGMFFSLNLGMVHAELARNKKPGVSRERNIESREEVRFHHVRLIHQESERNLLQITDNPRKL